MKRLGFAICAGALLLAPAGNAAGRFDQKLTADKQIVHVLNRLAFGPRPGDVEQVRRLGVDRWIDLQLHPDRIPENPELATRIQPLDTLQLSMWQINEKYAQPQQQQKAPQRPLQSMLTPLQMSKLRDGGTPEERREVLAALPCRGEKPGARCSSCRSAGRFAGHSERSG